MDMVTIVQEVDDVLGYRHDFLGSSKCHIQHVHVIFVVQGNFIGRVLR
jgi:hypothetical protein